MAISPGDWKLDVFLHGARPQGRVYAQGEKIATCWTADDEGHPLPSVDNARLMAAAPDLLAACRLLCKTAAKHGPQIGPWGEAERAGLAAIAKATGDTYPPKPEPIPANPLEDANKAHVEGT